MSSKSEFSYKRTLPELLAPAGNIRGAVGAINAGADAVYLGATSFSARAYAGNLSEEELLYIIKYAHLFGRKIYLACNILIKQKEWEQVFEMMDPLYENGLDAVIIQDIGLAMAFKERYPDMELHASTQMAVVSAEGASWLKEKGYVRVVPGRELSLKEIGSIKQRGIEVECFIHGAMCYSYSGRCLFSSLAGGRSGNRGRCAGPCRQLYHTADEKSGYFLSMKDMCTFEYLPEMIDAGIDSFKIEGRMKDPEYTAGVTCVYRKYMDLYAKTGEFLPKQHDLELLSSLYIRSKRQEGYLHKYNGRDMVSVDNPAYEKVPEGLKGSIAKKYLDTKMQLPADIYVYVFCDAPITMTVTCAGQSVTVSGEEAQKAIGAPLSKERIAGQVSKLGESFFQAADVFVDTDEESFVPMRALNELRRRAVEELEKSLCEKKRTLQSFERLSVSKSVTDPADPKETKDKGKTRDKKTDRKDSKKDSIIKINNEINNEIREEVFVGVRKKEQLRAALKQDYPSGIILDLALASDLDPDLYHKTLAWKEEKSGRKLFLRLPEIVREKYTAEIGKSLKDLYESGEYAAIYSGSIDGVALINNICKNAEIRLDFGLSVFNKASEKALLTCAKRYTVSAELNASELYEIEKYDAEDTLADPDAIRSTQRELLIYGYLPLMYSANCLLKTTKGCDLSAGVMRLYDEKKHAFSVDPVHRYCMNILYNGVPLSLHKQISEIKRKGHYAAFRLEGTIEKEEEFQSVLSGFGALLEKGEKYSPAQYTNGHYNRGVL